MKYSRVCHDCGFKSDRELEFCPECGTAKNEKFIESTLYGSTVKYFAKKIPKIDNAEMLVSLVINLLLLLIGILLINPIVESSELLWIFFLLYSIQGISKEISLRVKKFNRLHIISLGIISLYLGSGLGNLISYSGKIHNYYPGNYFYPDVLYEEFSSGNGLIVVGAISGFLFMIIIRYLIKFMK